MFESYVNIVFYLPNSNNSSSSVPHPMSNSELNGLNKTCIPTLITLVYKLWDISIIALIRG